MGIPVPVLVRAIERSVQYFRFSVVSLSHHHRPTIPPNLLHSTHNLFLDFSDFEMISLFITIMADDNEDEEEKESLLSLFDSLCVSYGDDDTIELLPRLQDDAVEPELVSYSMELQQMSQSLAYQLHYRFRPDYP
jgi:hypothetical protein